MANLNQVELEELKDQYRELIRQYGGTNLAGQQTPDGTYGYYSPDFSYGSYKIPYQDPTYSSGYEYARTIAGGMPFEDVVAPGMSFSPDQPMGYTQADLRREQIYGDFDGIMPKAPTKGISYAPNEGFVQMPSAPQGVNMALLRPFPEQTPFTGIPSFLQDLDFSNLPGVKTEEVIEPQQDFFKVDQNLFNFEQIADKIDMDEVAKIDIEKINIPESVSLFSDVLNQPVKTQPVLPSIFDQPTAPVMPTMPMEPMVQPITAPVMPAQTLPQSIVANIPTPQPLPMPVIPRIVEPRPIPAFVQPSVEEIVSPIRTGRTLPSAPRGLFTL
jgi:hypothetical protein